ncbi:MAG: metallophosphoesterase family protein [Kiritimatiellaeota bacterium]|nr:metallophosphoesterase family protein [Kiritimatiellota bacterium]
MKYAVISDIHANLEALTVVLDKCKEANVEKYICLGDIVGYNANPSECMELVRNLDLVACVKGNHDEYASCDDEEMLGFNPHAKQAVLWTKAHLTEEQRSWLSKLPMKKTVRGSNISIVHATLDSPDAWGYIFDTHHATDNFSYQFTQLCFCGHSHVPIAFFKKPLTMGRENPVQEIDSWRTPAGPPEELPDHMNIEMEKGWKYLINVGSVGQARNKDPVASFVIYDSDLGIVTRHRLQYDIESTQKKIIEAGLPERLALRLQRGN